MMRVDSQNHIFNKLKEIACLKNDWHYGEGVPPNKETLKKANSLIEQITMSMFDVDVFPGIDGEIMVTAYHKEHYLEFTIECDQTVTYVYQKQKIDISYEEGLSFNDTIERLDAFCDKIWNIPESYTPNITTKEDKNLRVSPLKTHRQVAFQSSQKNVLTQQTDTSVNTYKNITPTSPPFHQFSGYSHQMDFLLSMLSNNMKVTPEMSAMEISPA